MTQSSPDPVASGVRMIAPGYYWIDVLDTQTGDAMTRLENLQDWVKAYDGRVIRTSQHRDAGGDVYGFWLLFEVTREAPFPILLLGMPTVAPKGKDTQVSDTVQKPDVQDPLDALQGYSAGLSQVLLGGLVLGGLGFLAIKKLSE